MGAVDDAHAAPAQLGVEAIAAHAGAGLGGAARHMLPWSGQVSFLLLMAS